MSDSDPGHTEWFACATVHGEVSPPEQARDLEAARALALEWERTGVPARLAEHAPVAPSSPEAPQDSNYIAVETAVAAYMADSHDRGNSESTLQKKARSSSAGRHVTRSTARP